MLENPTLEDFINIEKRKSTLNTQQKAELFLLIQTL